MSNSTRPTIRRLRCGYRFLGLTILLTLAQMMAGIRPAAAQWQELTTDFFPNGDASQGHPIRLVFEAWIDREGLPLESPAPPPAEGTAERFLADYIGVLRDGTVEAAAAFWLATERADARQRLSPVFDQQKDLFATVTQSKLHTQVRYGGYLLGAVRHERAGDAKSIVAMYPLVETPEGYALSGALHQDPMFQILYFSVQDGLGLGSAFKTAN